MSDDQLREMATTAMRMAYQPTSFDKTFILADLRTARRIAAELGQALLDRLPPADDGERVGPEWLKANGWVESVPSWEYVLWLDVSLFWCDCGPAGDALWLCERGDKVFFRCKSPHVTRGYVRRLLAALEVPPSTRVTIEGVNGALADVPADDAPAF